MRGSEDGGLEELVELVLSRSSRSAIRRSKDCTSAATAACASGKRVSQMGCGSGGRSVMPPFYRFDGPVATMALERLPFQLSLPESTASILQPAQAPLGAPRTRKPVQPVLKRIAE